MRWQIWQRVTGRRETVTGKRLVAELVICLHNVRRPGIIPSRPRVFRLQMIGHPEGARQRLDNDRDETMRRVAELEREFGAIVASASGGSSGGDDEHDPEGATVAYERQHVAALLEQARQHLAAIEAAARKLGEGTYDRCDVCGGPIGAERLAARPAALTCVRCARAARR